MLLIGVPEAELSLTNFSQLEILLFFWFLKKSVSKLTKAPDSGFSIRNTRRSSGYRSRNLYFLVIELSLGLNDLIPAQIRELLAGIYSQVYVEYAVKVPTTKPALR